MENISHKNITRIKNITHENNQIDGSTAYLNIETKDFVLHYPDSKRGNILKSGVDDIIILYQKIGKKRYYSHLVQPIDNEEYAENVRANFNFGRWVRIIAFTGADNLIPLEKANEINLVNMFGGAYEIEKKLPKESLENYQLKIWKLFEPFFNPNLIDNSRYSQNFLNDELNEDFESSEGKLLFKLHRERERDGLITYQKKQLALKANKFFCEVCTFSFLEKYGEEYIECHHTLPISAGERITRLEDLSLVCSNCHRMLHRKIDGKYLSVNELKIHINKI